MKRKNFKEGIYILDQYTDPEGGIYAAHEQIYAGSADADILEKDVARLKELGWFEDKESWSCFT